MIATKPLQPAVFFDKDGTLVENVPYNVNCALLKLAPHAGEALRLLRDEGFAIVVITNQAGVAHGYFSIRDLRHLEAGLRALLSAEGAPLAGFYFCPHALDGIVPEYVVDCGCRKPEPGMIFQAAKDLQLDLDRSWFVGDLLDDVEAGHRAGCRAVFVDSGGETLWRRSPWRVPDITAENLLQAAREIVAADRANACTTSETETSP